MPHSTPLLAFDQVSKHYDVDGTSSREVLQQVSFEVPAGRTIAIVGRSGSGKSTLLHLAAGIDVPTSGRVHLGGTDLGAASEHDRTLLRRQWVGLVFQFFHLLPHLSVQDNIALPDWISGQDRSSSLERLEMLLERVGLSDRAKDTVQKLSGGEKQRVAICRALMPAPELLLADEPTGNLDDETGRVVMKLLLELTRDEGRSLIYVTHDAELAALADDVWHLGSGVLTRS